MYLERPGAVLQRDPQWVEKGVYKRGTINLIAGNPGIGKSFLTLELAARVSRLGERVLLLSAEDGIDDTILPRLVVMNADLTRIKGFSGFYGQNGQLQMLDLGRDIVDFHRYILTLDNVSLIVLDPISAYMGERAARSNIVAREVITRLKQIAIDAQCAIVCVTHLDKSSGRGGGAQIRTLDTDVLPALSSTVQIVHDHTRQCQRVISMVKNDVGEIRLPRVFEIYADRINWIEVIDNPEKNRFENGETMFYARRTKSDDACVFLANTLRNGPRPAKDIHRQARAKGMSKNTIERAKQTMGIRSFKQGRVWYWVLGSLGNN